MEEWGKMWALKSKRGPSFLGMQKENLENESRTKQRQAGIP